MIGSAIRQCQVRPTAMSVAGRDGMTGAAPARQALGISPNSAANVSSKFRYGQEDHGPRPGFLTRIIGSTAGLSFVEMAAIAVDEGALGFASGSRQHNAKSPCDLWSQAGLDFRGTSWHFPATFERGFASPVGRSRGARWSRKPWGSSGMVFAGPGTDSAPNGRGRTGYEGRPRPGR